MLQKIQAVVTTFTMVGVWTNLYLNFCVYKNGSRQSGSRQSGPGQAGQSKGDKSATDDLIKNNKGTNPSPPHRKLLGDFFHHVIKTYNDLPEEHKALIKGVVGKMVTNSVSGSKAMKDFTTNYEVYKDNVQNISNDIDALKTGDMTQKLDTVMDAYKTYTLEPNEDE